MYIYSGIYSRTKNTSYFIRPYTLWTFLTFAFSFLLAPFAPLEAALRLVYSFSECGPQFNTLVNEGTFPALIVAIHKTDISSHPHPQVVLAYFEICVRYIKHADSPSVRQFVTAMVDRRGLRNANKQVRCRTAYFLFKTAEALEGKASTLLSVVGSFAGEKEDSWHIGNGSQLVTTLSPQLSSVDRTLHWRGSLRG